MATNSKIEWTEHTWNPWIGCTKVSVGCDHCCAEAWCKRWGHDFDIVTRTNPATWRQPLAKDRQGNYKWKPGDTVFVNTLSDFWHPSSDPWRDEAYGLMRQRPDLTWILCTKRPERPSYHSAPRRTIFLASAENQETLDARAPLLISFTACGGVRGLSIEPMLGPIIIPDKILEWIDWVIVGGESGPHAVPMNPDWVRAVRDQCRDPGQGRAPRPFFFKQWGAWAPMSRDEALSRGTGCCAFGSDGKKPFGSVHMGRVGKKAAGRLLDGRTHDDFPIITS